MIRAAAALGLALAASTATGDALFDPAASASRQADAAALIAQAPALEAALLAAQTRADRGYPIPCGQGVTCAPLMSEVVVRPLEELGQTDAGLARLVLLMLPLALDRAAQIAPAAGQ
jgi:hypothetical protein